MKFNFLILITILTSCGLESSETEPAKSTKRPVIEETKDLEPCTCFQKTTIPPKEQPKVTTKNDIPSIRAIKQILRDNKALIEIVQSKIEALKSKENLTEKEKEELLSLNEELVQELNHKVSLLEQMNEILLSVN